MSPDKMELDNEPARSVADTAEPYLLQAINLVSTTGAPAHLYNSTPSTSNSSADLNPTQPPTLHPNDPNKILLYPGSFNPPHLGHLATILYLHTHRTSLNITSLILFIDPSSVVVSKHKKYSTYILPQDLRYQIFALVPEIQKLVEEKWLFLLVGDMESHIQVLRMATDMMVNDGWNTKLVGFLGGDKLSVKSSPDLPPGELGMWGSVDEFLIINARRPVDFYFPSRGQRGPRDLPGCTEWRRGGDKREGEEGVGKLWICKALTVAGKPEIQFRASERSESDGVSSTGIRRVMCEAKKEELFGSLTGKVLGVNVLVEWLVKSRAEKKLAADEILSSAFI